LRAATSSIVPTINASAAPAKADPTGNPVLANPTTVVPPVVQATE